MAFSAFLTSSYPSLSHTKLIDGSQFQICGIYIEMQQNDSAGLEMSCTYSLKKQKIMDMM